MNIDEHWWTLMNIDEHWWTLMNIDEHWWIMISLKAYFLRISSRCHCVSEIPRPCCCAISVWWNGPWVSIRKVWSFSKRCQWVFHAVGPIPLKMAIVLGEMVIELIFSLDSEGSSGCFFEQQDLDKPVPSKKETGLTETDNCNLGLSENQVYSQWNSHLIGIMISKTIGYNGVHNIFRHTHLSGQAGAQMWPSQSVDVQHRPAGCFWTKALGAFAELMQLYWCRCPMVWLCLMARKSKSIWVCLKMGYTPNYRHLVGIMISKTIGCRGLAYFQTNPIWKHTTSARQKRPSCN